MDVRVLNLEYIDRVHSFSFYQEKKLDKIDQIYSFMES